MKKLLLVVVSLMLVLGLSACGGKDEGDVLRWNIGADPATLDPGLNGASDGGNVINNTHEGLVREINGEVLPGIAESWDVSADGKTVTFNLRESNWSDGSALTADDFVYSWLRAMDPATASEYSWIWHYTNVVGAEDYVNGDGTAAEVGITAVDSYTFQVELIQPTNYFVSLMAFYHFMPVKESAVDAGADGTWAKDPDVYVSNGAFVLEEYKLGEGLTLVKNDEYWNADEVGIDTIEAKFIDDASTAYASYQSGDLDFIPSVPTDEVAVLIAESNEFYVFPLLGTYYYSFNMDKDGNGVNGDAFDTNGDEVDGLFVNQKLRTALSYSINREAITEALGAGQVPAGGFVPPGFLDDDGNDFFETAGMYGMVVDDGNFDEAVTLFEEAATELGMTVSELITALEGETLLYNTSEGHQFVAEKVQEQWANNLGFTINLANEEWAVFQDTRSAGNFDIARGGWLTDFMDPSGLLSIFESSNAYNDPNYYNDTFDQLLADATAATDESVHFDKLYEAQEEFMNDMPIIPVYHYTDTMLVSDVVVNWGRSVLGSVDFTRTSIDRG
ncbi:MAG: peptide ABC transporter substrate-binding protein [Candidatus Izimaplasma sp.]|nr:peptide ABC transporter substrate-binding protein [Candidatus Izimaplasma bacterium]